MGSIMESKKSDPDSGISKNDDEEFFDAPRSTNIAVKNINYFLPADDHRKIKLHAVEKQTTLQAIMAEAMQMYFDRHGLGQMRRAKSYRK